MEGDPLTPRTSEMVIARQTVEKSGENSNASEVERVEIMLSESGLIHCSFRIMACGIHDGTEVLSREDEVLRELTSLSLLGCLARRIGKIESPVQGNSPHQQLCLLDRP